jgi:hypothetical protein
MGDNDYAWLLAGPIRREDYNLRADDLAYVDTFRSGLLPVKVQRIYYQAGQFLADVKVTADRRAYDRGEVLQEVKVDRLLHRKQVYTRSGQYRIRGQVVLHLSEGMPRHRDGSLDERYSVRVEGTGHATKTWVARFCGEWLGCCATKARAEKLAREHTL